MNVQSFSGEAFHAPPICQDAEFEDCVFLSCRIAMLESCRFNDCKFESCDLANANLGGSSFQRVSFVDSRLVGVDWRTAAAFSFTVSFSACDLSYCDFTGRALARLKAQDCSFREATFDNADLSRAEFPGCDFSGATFRRTRVTRTDLSSARNYWIDPRENTLRETRFSTDAALQHLAHLGIVLPD